MPDHMTVAEWKVALWECAFVHAHYHSNDYDNEDSNKEE
jgi:hypothetical protein